MAPATSQEMALHSRLLAGDETASAETFERYVDDLVRHLMYRRREIVAHDAALVDEAVSDTLFDYIASPEKYDPQQKSLIAYLYMLAERDLLNRWRKVPIPEKAGKVLSLDDIAEHEFDSQNGKLCHLDDFEMNFDLVTVICRAWRVVLAYAPRGNFRKTRKFLDNFVELHGKSGNRYIGGTDAPERWPSDAVILRQFWKQVMAIAPDTQERDVLVLMLFGERETDAFAEALGLAHLTAIEQANEVKRVKDKLKKRLQRADWRDLIEEACGDK